MNRERARLSRPAERRRPLDDVVRTSGDALDGGTRARMEARLGHDLSAVRIHADSRAARSAAAVGARAYTVGRHVVFGEDELAPGRPDGERLLAHELTHAIQQGFAEPGGEAAFASPADPTEIEAAVASEKRSHAPALRAPVHVARQPVPTLAEHQAEVARFELERSEFEADRARARVHGASRAVAESLAAARGAEPAQQPALIAATEDLVRELAAALRESVEVLERRAGELERRLAGGEPVKRQLDQVRAEIADDRRDLDVMRGLFASSTLTAFGETYKTQLDGAKCMVRAYEGLGTLFSKAESDAIKRKVAQKAKRSKAKGGANVDQFITVMRTARSRGIAGPEMVARWNPERRRWTPTLSDLLQSRVSRTVPGVYYFAFAPAKAYHSLIIVVNTWANPPILWWGDQSGVVRLTKSLDETARAYLEGEAAAGRLTKFKYWHSYLWQLLPPAGSAVVEAGE